MPHPNFFGFRGCAPTTPGSHPFLRPDHAPAKVRFPSVPCLGFEHDSDRFAASLSNRCQPAPDPWPGRVEDGSNPATRNRRASRNHSAPIFNITPDYVERMFRAHRPKAAQPAPKKVQCLELARGLVVCRRAMTKIEVLSVHVCTSCGP